jgi:hypothetical protein
MGLAAGVVLVAALVLGLLVFALFDQGRARKASASLRSMAEEVGALPIASMRNGAQIVFLRRQAGASDTPFIMLHAGESRPMSADEIRRLWNGGRLWWYHAGETPPVGLRYYLRYVDGQYTPSCRLAKPDDPSALSDQGDRAESDNDVAQTPSVPG